MLSSYPVLDIASGQYIVFAIAIAIAIAIDKAVSFIDGGHGPI